MSAKDYRSGNRLFYREEQAHWWLTGFKFGYVDSRKIVVVATLKAFDHEMANAIEKSFEKLTGSAVGRQKFKYMTELDGQTTDCYTRKGYTFTVVWEKAGFENCANLTNVQFHPNQTVKPTIGQNAFSNINSACVVYTNQLINGMIIPRTVTENISKRYYN